MAITAISLMVADNLGDMAERIARAANIDSSPQSSFL
jgi:hypothetical protein